MQHFLSHPELFNKPLRISKEQSTDAIKTFFQEFALYEVRQNLWNWLEAALTTENGWFDEPQDRASLIAFYYSLEELVEAAQVINEQTNSQ
jgi:hypothetical protein